MLKRMFLVCMRRVLLLNRYKVLAYGEPRFNKTSRGYATAIRDMFLLDTNWCAALSRSCLWSSARRVAHPFFQVLPHHAYCIQSWALSHAFCLPTTPSVDPFPVISPASYPLSPGES